MNGIKKTNWLNSFSIIGKVRINDNSFKIDEESDSGWRYNNLNLGIDSGEEYGLNFCNMMGGYSTKKDNVIYVHGKKDDDADDFKNTFTVNWDDRNNDEIVDTIGKYCFITVALEKTDNGNKWVRKFLSPYDAIAYIKEHLNNGDAVIARGNLKYSIYKGKVTMQREITNLEIYNGEPSGFKAEFKQSVLIDEDSVNQSVDIDNDRNCLRVHAKVLDYVKEMDGREIGRQFPLSFDFDYQLPEGGKLSKQVYEKLFNSKPGYFKQVNFEGKFVNAGATVTATADDLTDDVKEMIALGFYSEDEILTKYATTGKSERRNILVRPTMKKIDEELMPIPCIYEERYTHDELYAGNAVKPTQVPVEDEEDLENWLHENIDGLV